MKIPFNKMTEKPNIFLPIINADVENNTVIENTIVENNIDLENEVVENMFMIIENEM
jgi:hypothetical protein